MLATRNLSPLRLPLLAALLSRSPPPPSPSTAAPSPRREKEGLWRLGPFRLTPAPPAPQRRRRLQPLPHPGPSRPTRPRSSCAPASRPTSRWAAASASGATAGSTTPSSPTPLEQRKTLFPGGDLRAELGHLPPDLLRGGRPLHRPPALHHRHRHPHRAHRGLAQRRSPVPAHHHLRPRLRRRGAPLSATSPDEDDPERRAHQGSSSTGTASPTRPASATPSPLSPPSW